MARAKKEKKPVEQEPFVEGMHFLGWAIVDAAGIKPHKTGHGSGMPKIYRSWGRADGIRKQAYNPDRLVTAPVFIQPAAVVATALTLL